MAITSEGAKTNVFILRIDILQDFEVVVHMREVVFIDILGTTFHGCTWKGRDVNLRIISHYPKIILANILVVVWRVEILDSLDLHWNFFGIEMLSSWVAFFRNYKATFLVIWRTLLRIAWTKINATLIVASEGTIFDEAQATIEGYDLASTIHVLWIALISHDGGLIIACSNEATLIDTSWWDKFDIHYQYFGTTTVRNFIVLGICYHGITMITSYDVRELIPLILSREVISYLTIDIKGVEHATLEL